MSWETSDSFDSSNITPPLRYENTTNTLEVTFHNGGTYHYFDVEEQVWNDFKTAESKGKFLHARIKGNFRYSKV